MASGLGCGINKLEKGRRKQDALLPRIANRGIAVVFAVGVDIAIHGVDIAILRVDIAILGVDIAILRVDITILGVDIAILGVDIVVLGVDIAVLGVEIVILGVKIAILRRQKEKHKSGGGLRGREGVVSRVKHFETGWSVHESVDTGSHKGRGAPCYIPTPRVRPGWGLGCREIL